jgi:hypothetical protein
MVRFHWALCAIDLCAVVMSIHCHYDTAISDLERGGWRMPSIDTFRRLKSDSFNRHNWYHRRHTSVTDLKQRPGTAHDYSSAKRRQIIPNLSSTVLPREAGLRSFARGSPHCIDGHSLYECPKTNVLQSFRESNDQRTLVRVYRHRNYHIYLLALA